MGRPCGTHEILIKISVEKSQTTREFGRSGCTNVTNTKTVCRDTLVRQSAERMDTLHYARCRNLAYFPYFPWITHLFN